MKNIILLTRIASIRLRLFFLRAIIEALTESPGISPEERQRSAARIAAFRAKFWRANRDLQAITTSAGLNPSRDWL